MRRKHRGGILSSSVLAGRTSPVASAELASHTTPVIPAKHYRQLASSFGRLEDCRVSSLTESFQILEQTPAYCLGRIGQLLQLAPSMGVQSLIGGVIGSSAATLAFQVHVELDGIELPCRLQADFVGKERILGRDVLNRLEVLFRGPAGEVVVNP